MQTTHAGSALTHPDGPMCSPGGAGGRAAVPAAWAWLATALLALLAGACGGADSDEPRGHLSRRHADAAESSQPEDDAAGGAPIEFYLSMHGERGGNTIVGLTRHGTLRGSVLAGDTAGALGDAMKDLRGMVHLADGDLLVVSAWKDDTRVLRFGPPGADGVRQLVGVFAQQGPSNPAMVHTYAIATAPDGSIYASNQDTNCVTRYAGPGAAQPGAPLPSPPALSQFGQLPPGTFVPSAMVSPLGLTDVRGIAFGPDGLLYVADRGAARVSAYDTASGERVRIVADASKGLRHPIQLRFSLDGQHLFVGDNGYNGVFRIKLDDGSVHEFVKPGHGGLDAPSGLALDHDHLYVGSRRNRQILRYKLSDGSPTKHPLVQGLPDAPEFLIWAGEAGH